MNKIIRILIVLVIFVTLSPLLHLERAAAQDEAPAGPTYVVRPGDTLYDIALRFGVTLDELIKINKIKNASRMNVGDELIIPHLESFQGRVSTVTVPYGETLRSYSRRYHVPQELLARLNHLISPGELYAGAELVGMEADIFESVDTATGAGVPRQAGRRLSLAAGQSLLELAVLQGTDVWTLRETNALSRTMEALPGDVLRADEAAQGGPGAFPGQIEALDLAPLPMVQGKTSVISLTATAGITFTGELISRTLQFFPPADGNLIAMQGIPAQFTPGFYPLELKGRLTDGTPFGLAQMVYIKNGGYIQDLPIRIDPAGMDENLTQAEDAQWLALATPFTAQRMWQGLFQFPAKAVYKDCYPSTFGRRRSYNGSEYRFFHTGLDICGQVGDDVYAPAAGVVVFAGPLTVRGNATLIDHGWGVYTGYMHQSELLVSTGERVEVGQLIGRVGRTGLRITGPHLHWEVWVAGVQVDPMDWLTTVFP